MLYFKAIKVSVLFKLKIYKYIIYNGVGMVNIRKENYGIMLPIPIIIRRYIYDDYKLYTTCTTQQ